MSTAVRTATTRCSTCAVSCSSPGLENTAFSIRATLRHLAVNQDHLAAVVADPALVTNLVEQSLRLYAPVTALARTVDV